jgi:hypothetical protein
MSYFNGPSLVTDGLMLCLDAGNKKSYPGTGNWTPAGGTTWTDLINASNNCALTGNPNFSSSNNGVFYFDGNDYATAASPSLPSGTGNKTILVWALPDSTGPSDTYTGLVSYGNRSVNTPSTAILLSMNTTGATYYVSSAYWGNDYVPNSLAVTKNNWNMIGIIARGAGTINNTTLICGNSDGINKVTGSSSAYTRGLNTSSTSLFIGSTDTPGRYMKGYIAMVVVYNKELTDNEIKQNFNATRGRFGL